MLFELVIFGVCEDLIKEFCNVMVGMLIVIGENGVGEFWGFKVVFFFFGVL